MTVLLPPFSLNSSHETSSETFPFFPISTCRLFLSEFHDDVMWQYNVMRNQNLSWSIFALIVCCSVLRPGSSSSGIFFCCCEMLKHTHSFYHFIPFESISNELFMAVSIPSCVWLIKNESERMLESERGKVSAPSFDIRFTCWSKRLWKIIQGNGFADRIRWALKDRMLSAPSCLNECESNFNYGCEVVTDYNRDLSKFYCRQKFSVLNLPHENWLNFHPSKSDVTFGQGRLLQLIKVLSSRL